MQYDKDTFQQWWEFLKLSKPYKSICELVSIHREGALDFPLIKRFLNELEINDNFRPTEKYMKLLAVYEKFGDVHNDDFKEWWQKYNQPKSVKTVLELYDYKEERETRMTEALKTEDEQLQSYIKFWEQIIYFPDLYTHIELYVNLNRPMNDINSDMSAFIKELRQDAEKNKRERINERNDYLRVLRLSLQGDSISQIIKKIGSKKEKDFFKRIGGPEEGTPDCDTLRSYRNKKHKAEEILKNVEIGKFP